MDDKELNEQDRRFGIGKYDNNGQKHGAWIYYYPNGRMEHRLPYGDYNDMDLLYAVRNISSRGYYRNGQMVGIWYTYDQQGKLESTFNFDNQSNDNKK